MVGNIKAENVFGQVLICLRMSKLDYMVKEPLIQPMRLKGRN
jgi:hypothetical protein